MRILANRAEPGIIHRAFQFQYVKLASIHHVSQQSKKTLKDSQAHKQI
jgi:hypothetical protein